MLSQAVVQFILFPPRAGIPCCSLAIRYLRPVPGAVMDGLVCRIRHADNILWVKQCFPVLENILFRQRVDVVYRNAHPAHLSAADRDVRDRVVFTSEVASSVPHDDPIPELPPLLRAVKVLVQVSVKPKGIFTNLSMQLQICQPLLECPTSAHLAVAFHFSVLMNSYTSNIMPCRSAPQSAIQLKVLSGFFPSHTTSRKAAKHARKLCNSILSNSVIAPPLSQIYPWSIANAPASRNVTVARNTAHTISSFFCSRRRVHRTRTPLQTTPGLLQPKASKTP